MEEDPESESGSESESDMPALLASESESEQERGARRGPFAPSETDQLEYGLRPPRRQWSLLVVREPLPVTLPGL